MQTMRGVIRCASFGRQEVEQFREDAVRGHCSGKTVSPLRISVTVSARGFDPRSVQVRSLYPQPFDLLTRLFEHLILNHGERCSNPRWVTIDFRDVAQMEAHVLWEHDAAGSSPVIPTNSRSDGTGRHDGFKTRWRNPCGFNSHLRDHTTHAYYNSCCMYYIWAYIISKD